ncbi:hypothetical protein ACM9HB_33585, partial [Streptomyces sp. JAC128]|uniref:hypothetical protein n=1 Tax=Streptomyces sp. JAC128 TaxID=3418412 RepID=UPI003D815FCF
ARRAPSAVRRPAGCARPSGATPAGRLHASEGTASVVVDCESGFVRLGLAAQLARDLGGSAVTLDELRADSIAGLVKDITAAGRAA